MKKFSAEELNIIKQIYDNKDNATYVVTNIFMDIVFGHGIAFNITTGEILYEFSKHNIGEILAIQKIVINRALLIKYLEENKYIYLINDGSSVGGTAPVGDTITTPIVQTLPTEIADILRRTRYRVLVDYSLISFINNGFKTQDDIQIEEAKKQTIISKNTLRWSVGASFLALFTFLANVIIPLATRINYSKEVVDPICKSIETINVNVKDDSDVHIIITQLDSLLNVENRIIGQNMQLIHKPTKVYKKYYKLEFDTLNCDGQKVITIPMITK